VQAIPHDCRRDWKTYAVVLENKGHLHSDSWWADFTEREI
jgi:hypothetical protein